jgi:hypothetical protein
LEPELDLGAGGGVFPLEPPAEPPPEEPPLDAFLAEECSPAAAPPPAEELGPPVVWVPVDPDDSVVLVAGAFAPGEETEITWAGVVTVLAAPARPISTPTPIASSSTPTPAIALRPVCRRGAAGGVDVGGCDPIAAGVKLSRNRLRASGRRAPHSRQ